MASKFSRQAATVVGVTLGLTGLWWWGSPRLMHVAAQRILESNADESRRTAPDFSLKDINGHTVRLSDFRGRVVLLNFWATWCPPCKVEIPWFVEFENQYQAMGLTVLGVSMDEDGWKAVKPFLEARNINYPIVVGNEDISVLYGGIDSLPTTLLIGRDGRTEFYHQGLVGRGEYQTEILQLLTQKKDETRIKDLAPPRAFEPLLLARRSYRFDLDGFGFGVQSAGDGHLFRGEFFRGLLIAQRVDVLAIIENVLRAVRIDAGKSTLGIRRSHFHAGMIGRGTHIVRNGASELLPGRWRGQRCNCEKTQDQRLHDYGVFIRRAS
jgi:cytochrome c biogenesis protein CcmG/thiol:disulfide interchange protein DsbE